jgi:hypothetical protein
MRIYDTALCLLAAHLSSGENEGDELKRNYDYSEIVRRGAFPADVAALDPAAALPGQQQQQDGVAKVTLLDALLRVHTFRAPGLHRQRSALLMFLGTCASSLCSCF